MTVVPKGWLGELSLRYRAQQGRTVAQDRHTGPLRVLQSLYPEGPAICHHVLVHPPGGLVGGDELVLQADLDSGTHALITTPGATRYYRSDGLQARQTVRLKLAAGSRLEWLPMETIAHPGCAAVSQVQFELAPGAAMMGWDLLALGLPASKAAFDSGRFEQRLHWPGVWLERAQIDATDDLLLNSPLGLAGHRAVGTLWFASGSVLAPALAQSLKDQAREVAGASALATSAGCTAPDPRLVVLRVLAPRVEPAMTLLQAVWAEWRTLAWGLEPTAPRLWRT